MVHVALYLDRGGENAIYLHIGLKRAMHKKKSRNLEPAKRIRKGTNAENVPFKSLAQ